jgi:hypothetical protein
MALLLMALSACTNSNNGNTTAPTSQTPTNSSTGQPSASTPGTTEEATHTEPPMVKAIVFDDTIEGDDTFSGIEGSRMSQTLRLILFEISPGVYEGEGTFTKQQYSPGHPSLRDVITIDYFTSIDSMKYLYFPDMKPGESTGCNKFNWSEYTEKQTARVMKSDYYNTPGDNYFGTLNTKSNLIWAKPDTEEYTLSFDGDAAQFRVKYEDVVFHGTIAELPPVKPDRRLDRLDGKCVSINSAYMERDKKVNYEYRAMLTAKQTQSYEYTGDLCVRSMGNSIPLVDELVSFTLKPFDEQAYKNSGGYLPFIFDAYGVIETSKGKYIVLTDNDRVLIHPANSVYTFIGEFVPESRFEEERRVAGETKEMLKFLYIDYDYFNSNFRDTDGSSYYSNSLPAWYPSSFMPEPYGFTYEGHWWNPWGVNDPSSNFLTNFLTNFTYYANYRENYSFHIYNDGWNNSKVYETYASQLSGYDGYEEYLFERDDIYFEDEDAYLHEIPAVCIYYNVGAYRVRIVIETDYDDIFFPKIISITYVKIDIR